MTRRPLRTSYGLLLLALAFGFAVRVYRLDAQSLWNDEGTSVALARLSVPAIANGAAHDIHPPLYYFLLHFWMSAAGDGEFAVRFLSVLAGVLLIAVIYRLARTLAAFSSSSPAEQGARVGLIAALLSALSAFQVYYSQETRMYIWVALFASLSVLAAVQWLNQLRITNHASPITPHQLRITFFYILATLAALYTHYFAPTLLLIENLAFVLWLVFAYRGRNVSHLPSIGQAGNPNPAGKLYYLRLLGLWIGGQVIVGLSFLPWLAFAGNQLTSWPAISDQFSLPDLMLRVLSAFVLGIDTPLGNQTLLVAAFGLLFLCGLVLRFSQNPWGILLCALWALVPLGFMYIVSLQRPAYNPKFLLLATPGFILLVAQGITGLTTLRIRSRAPVRVAPFILLSGLALVGAWIALQGVYKDPRLQRDDYRGVIGYINRVATAEDAVLVDAPGQMDIFNYYYHGAAEVQALPIGRPLLPVPTEEALSRLNDHRNLFAVFWATDQADPGNFVERYLAKWAHKGLDEWHGNIRLAQYAVARGWTEEIQQVYDVRFGDEFELALVYLGGRTVQPGRVYPIDLLWHTLQPPRANYKVFVHLLDSQGKIKSQRDTEPQDGFRPTSTWKQGEGVQDQLGLLIPGATPPGDYDIELGLYRPEDGTRLPLSTGGDHLILGTVRVEK